MASSLAFAILRLIERRRNLAKLKGDWRVDEKGTSTRWTSSINRTYGACESADNAGEPSVQHPLPKSMEMTVSLLSNTEPSEPLLKGGEDVSFMSSIGPQKGV